MKAKFCLLPCVLVAIFVLGCSRNRELDESVYNAIVDVLYFRKDPRGVDIQLLNIDSINDYADSYARATVESNRFNIFGSLAWRYYEWDLLSEAGRWNIKSNNSGTLLDRDMKIMIFSLAGMTEQLISSLDEVEFCPVGKETMLRISNEEYEEASLAAVEKLASNSGKIYKRRYYLYVDFVSRILVKAGHELPLELGDRLFDSLVYDFVRENGWTAFIRSLENGSEPYFQSMLLEHFSSILANASIYFKQVGDHVRSEQYKSRLWDIAEALEKSEDKRSEWLAYLYSKTEK